MVTLFLIILVLIELARLLLQYLSGNRTFESKSKSYVKSIKAENFYLVQQEQNVKHELEYWGNMGYEIVAVIDLGKDEYNIHNFMLFFTKRHVKTFVE